MVENKAGLLATYYAVWGILENSKKSFSNCDISETGELLGLGMEWGWGNLRSPCVIGSLVHSQLPRFQPILLLRQTC